MCNSAPYRITVNTRARERLPYHEPHKLNNQTHSSLKKPPKTIRELF